MVLQKYKTMIIDTDKVAQLTNCFDSMEIKDTIKELQSLKTSNIQSELISNTLGANIVGTSRKKKYKVVKIKN